MNIYVYDDKIIAKQLQGNKEVYVGTFEFLTSVYEKFPGYKFNIIDKRSDKMDEMIKVRESTRTLYSGIADKINNLHYEQTALLKQIEYAIATNKKQDILKYSSEYKFLANKREQLESQYFRF